MNYGTPAATQYYLMVRVSTKNLGGASNRATDTQERLKIEVQGQVLYDGDLLVGFPGTSNDFSFRLPFHSNGEQLNVLITYNAPNGVDTAGPETYQTVFQVALSDIDQVLDPNGVNCLTSGCPEKTGFDLGLTE